jgi:hypothetical protein
MIDSMRMEAILIRHEKSLKKTKTTPVFLLQTKSQQAGIETLISQGKPKATPTKQMWF